MNGAPSGEGFVIVSTPAQPLPGTLTLRTTDGSEGDVIVRPAQENVATIVIIPTEVHVSGEPVSVHVQAGSMSASQNDTAIEIMEGNAVVARLELTALGEPRVRFTGRFQCRLATDGDAFDEKWGTELSFFRVYAVDGGNPLDSTAIPAEPPLDRFIRFHDGVALRPLCDPIGVSVTSIEADVGPSRLRFTVGDSLIGLPLQLGPQCRFEEKNGVFARVGLQPIADFRLTIGSVFTGESEPAVERHNPDPTVRPSKAPYADGGFFLDQIGPWKPSDFGYTESTWQAHADAVVNKKLSDLLGQEPADEPAHSIWQRRVVEHQTLSRGIRSALQRVQRFFGEIDRALEFPPAPVSSLAYLQTLPSIAFYAEFFDFDTDCQCGTVTGTLGAPTPPPVAPESARLAPAEVRGAPAEAGPDHP